MKQPRRQPPRPLSRRAALLLAVAMLGVGVGVGAAIGPAPSASFAGVSPALLQRLPALLAAIASRSRAQSQAQSAASEPPEAPSEEATVPLRPRHKVAASSNQESEAPTESTPATQKSAGEKNGSGAKLPAITSVWLIELAGESFAEASAQPTAAPYITGTALRQGALLSGWSALQGSALASEAALLAPVPVGGTPPLLHSIVQPPCPEGAAGAACSTPAGALSAADTFLKETLATITSTSAYSEHGLVVITFASVGVATQEGLPTGTSSATLIEKPPAGVLVLSPFAKAGSHPSRTFNPTSPSQSLRALLG